MADNYYGFDDGDEAEKGKDNLFLWTIFILLLIGVAAACWMGSFYIFSRPEDPRFYPFLVKLKKLTPPVRYEVTAAPPGEFLTPSKLFERYSKFTRLELEKENGELLRNYIRNYRETKKLTPYITGRFEIISTYELKKSDMFASGVVALAQSLDFPQVIIEHVYPTAKENVATLRTMLQTGLDMKIERTNDLSAIIHVEKIQDGRLQFTLVPLLYGTYALKQGVGTFSLEPPQVLNMAGGVPITKGAMLKDALAKYVDFKRSHPSPDTASASPDAPPPPPSPELVRLDTVEPGAKVPETGALPTVPIATPIPIPGHATPRHVAVVTPIPAPLATPKMVAKVTPAVTPATVAMLNTPRPTPTPIAAATPPMTAAPPPVAPPPVQTSPTGVPLKPFIASAPAPGAIPRAPGSTWRTYQPGRAPAGRAISPLDAGELADRGDLGEKLYLQGDFRVTASGENSAVFRDRAAGADPANPSPLDTVRIVVAYPAGAVPPRENAVLSRDASRPLEVVDIRKGSDGQVNIYVREIISQ